MKNILRDQAGARERSRFSHAALRILSGTSARIVSHTVAPSFGIFLGSKSTVAYPEANTLTLTNPVNKTRRQYLIAHTVIKINSPSPKAFLSNPSRWSSLAGPGLLLNQRVPFSHVSLVSSPAPVCGIGSSSTPSAKAPSCRQSPSESLSGPVDKTRTSN